MKISEAYLLFGFKDYSGFYKAFRKEYGMSPKEWQETVMNLPEFSWKCSRVRSIHYIHVHNAWMSIDLITGIIKEK